MRAHGGLRDEMARQERYVVLPPPERAFHPDTRRTRFGQGLNTDGHPPKRMPLVLTPSPPEYLHLENARRAHPPGAAPIPFLGSNPASMDLPSPAGAQAPPRIPRMCRPSSLIVLRRIAVALALFLAAFGLYYRILADLSGFAYWFNDLVFYSDTHGTYSHMKEISLEGDMRKHPLFSVTVHPLVAVVRTLSDIGNREAARRVLAFLAALNVLGMYLLLLKALETRVLAFLLASLYGILFSNLVFFALPETYSLSNLGILLFFLAAAWVMERFRILDAALLGGLAGVGALLNPPLGLLVLAVWGVSFLRLPRRDAVRACLLATVTSIVIFLGTNLLLFGSGFFEYSRKYTGKWADPANLFVSRNWANVGVSFFVYGVISPLEDLARSISLGNVLGYFSSPMKTLLAIIYAAFFPVAAVYAVRRRDPLAVASCIWLAALLGFYVYFNPREAFLYSCQALAPLLLALGFALAEIPWKGKIPALAAFTAALAWINLQTF